MPLRASPFTVSIYRRDPDGLVGTTEAYDWSLVAEAVAMDIQGRQTGLVDQQAVGRMVIAKYNGFANNGVDLRADDGVQIDTVKTGYAGWLNRRFMVTGPDAPDWGSRGGIQFELSDTYETFGNEPES